MKYFLILIGLVVLLMVFSSWFLQVFGILAIEWVPKSVYFIQDTAGQINESLNPSPTPEPIPCVNFKAASTPELIGCAFSSGDISEGERIFYLQYAFTDYNKLPKKFQSNEPWDGTMVLLEIKETVENPEKFCKFDVEIRRELMKYYPHASSCAMR